MTSELRTALEDQLGAARVPPGDVARALRQGNRRRRLRRTVATAAVGAVAVAVGFAAARLSAPEVNTEVIDPAGVGQLDFSAGLRAYADPGGSIFLGGRELDASDLEYLDTDATATSAGLVFYDRGRPMLLAESGEVRALMEGAVEVQDDFHPTAKADSTAPLVAWATLRDGVATITVHDLASDTVVDSLDVDCGDCADLVIEALDDRVVLFRTDEETRMWEVGDESSQSFADAGTQVADLRNGVLLHDGPAPTSTASERFLAVRAPVDAQLTFDGRHVLNWSSLLQNTRSGEPPIRLEVGPEEGLGFWNIDTDGSVLVASLAGKYPDFVVHDCEIPSGECTKLGPLTPTGGDPMFIGNDM